MRQFNAITNSFQSSIPQTWLQRKINCHQKFTDVLHRRKWGWRLIYQAVQSNITLKAFWRGTTEQLVSRERFVWDLQGLRNNRIHQTLSLTQPKLSWGLCSVSFETTFAKTGVGASWLKGGCSLGPVDFSGSNCPWSFNHSSGSKCVESRTCRGIPILSFPVSTQKHQREGV